MLLPMAPVLSIDLVRDGVNGREFVGAIGMAPMVNRGSDGQISWTIPQNIPQGSSYRVRISGPDGYPVVRCGPNEPCPLPMQGGSGTPSGSASAPSLQGTESFFVLPPYPWRSSDESDGTFSIVNGSTGQLQLQHMRDEITAMIASLQALLDEINAKLRGL
jgi:hypothetical protein